MNVEEFVLVCQQRCLKKQEDYKIYFAEVVNNTSNHDKELLLQAFLFFNIKIFFPSCTDVLIFEKSPDLLGNTQFGKCDFIYLTSDQEIFLIETKFINTEATGKTAKKRRNEQRNKVINQVKDLREKIHICWNIPLNKIKCGVFTTDSQVNNRGFAVNVVAKSISIDALEEWQVRQRNEQSNDYFDKSKNLEDLLYAMYSCEICSHSEICKNLRMCWLDFLGD
jgi:hypothetical protein